MGEKLTAVLHPEEGGYYAHCPELDVGSQGRTIEEAVANLKEAVELWLETASAEEQAEQRAITMSFTANG